MTGDNKKRREGPIRRFTRRTGRNLTALSIPYIMLGYPIAGYFIGWFIMKTFHWPSWVPILVMMLALVQGFREVIRIAVRIAKEDENSKDDIE
jgi:F0F1-type ATP synthase assembly protein I